MPNMMREIASDLGVRLEERFKVKVGKDILEPKYVLLENGLFLESPGEVSTATSVFIGLLIGTAEIVKLPCRPMVGEPYYRWTSDNIAENKYWRVSSSLWEGDTFDVAHLDMGNCFRTKEEAEAHKDEIIRRYSEVLEGRNDEKK